MTYLVTQTAKKKKEEKKNSCNVNIFSVLFVVFEAMKLRCVLGKPS